MADAETGGRLDRRVFARNEMFGGDGPGCSFIAKPRGAF